MKTITESPKPAGCYLLIIYNDVEPHIMGPYTTDDERLEAARRHRCEFGSDDGLFRLDAEGRVDVDVFAAAELES